MFAIGATESVKYEGGVGSNAPSASTKVEY